MNKSHLWLYITICVLAFVTSKIIIAFLLYWRWYRNHRVCEDGMAGGKMVLFKTSGKDSFTSETLLKKILNLTSKDIIGTGGFATVYKVVIDERTAFAIKRLSRGSIDQERGFERELDAMGDIKHRNVVTLRGYYSTSHVNILVYDLMKNGSLDTILHSSPNKVSLDWSTRHKIALGAARGIAYLHHDCIPRIIHRDIKSSNILLDEDMDARIADFGLATLINPQQSHVSTLVAGTFGYLAPEYVDTGRATEKGDVYSYGVVLLELLTGKRPTDEAFIEKGNNMVASVKSLIEDGCEEYAFDAELTDLSTQKEIKDAFLIAYKCLNQNPVERPSMAQVVKMLEQIKSGSFTLQIRS
ncbi:receptor-like serine/threonine-protein kinase At1g78530 isoform X2 [Cryptomeria japonica]|uniref:receptor-like serine/threonine-protein kinase At1g78530 isoform X2 n=1 Tax=Cryptomeria japonica TaxID=3369 RepID=UPI0027DA8058|nr:receptor-like serine/threonine-protein kinase At1g78530 isoform X2 [Cryptomeria japonica]